VTSALASRPLTAKKLLTSIKELITKIDPSNGKTNSHYDPVLNLFH